MKNDQLLVGPTCRLLQMKYSSGLQIQTFSLKVKQCRRVWQVSVCECVYDESVLKLHFPLSRHWEKEKRVEIRFWSNMHLHSRWSFQDHLESWEQPRQLRLHQRQSNREYGSIRLGLRDFNI